MQFKPKSEQEINEANLIPDKSVCDFEVVKATDTKSKKTGAEMIAIKLKVFYGEGFKLVDDYLLESMAAKLRHFCEAGNLMKEYADGSLRAEHCNGVCGKAKIKVDPEGDFPAKNSIRDYVVEEKEKVLDATSRNDGPVKQSDSRLNPQAKPAETGADGPPPEDDDVPF